METREIRRLFYRDGYRVGHTHLDQKIDPDSLNGAIRQLYKAVDDLLESFLERSASEGIPAECKKGCSWCCYQEVYAVSHELLFLQDHMRKHFSGEQQERIVRRAREKARLTVDLPEGEQLKIRAACPFLESESCMVYEARPMACRIYLSSAVSSCRNAYDRPEDLKITPQLFEFPLTAGRMLNEGFVAYLKQRGLRSGEWPIEQGIGSLADTGQTMEDWIRGSGTSI